MWGAVQGDAPAFTDAASTACDAVSSAKVYWGFQNAEGTGANFGSDCGSSSLVGTPCAPGVQPQHRYNFLFVRSGAVVQPNRLGLSMKVWKRSTFAEYRALWSQAAWLTDHEGEGRISNFMAEEVVKLDRDNDPPASFSKVASEAFFPREMAGMRSWTTVSYGHFRAPIDGEYMFMLQAEKSNGMLFISQDGSKTNMQRVTFSLTTTHNIVSRWLTMRAGQDYYMEWWHTYLDVDVAEKREGHIYGMGYLSVRIATADSSGSNIPDDLKAVGAHETAVWAQDNGILSGLTRAPGGLPYGVMYEPQRWDDIWRANWCFDPIPEYFLRRSGPVEIVDYKPGGRGLLREWWAWEDEGCVNPDTEKLRLDEAWSFPFAASLNSADPSTSEAPHGSSIIQQMISPAPFTVDGSEKACYAERVTGYFRAKVDGDYQFKLWTYTMRYGRLYFNPDGTDPSKAVEVAASRATQYPNRWRDHPYLSGRATTPVFTLRAGELYYMQVVHGGVGPNAEMRITMEITTTETATIPSTRATPSETTPCNPTDEDIVGGTVEINLLNDDWFIVATPEPQVTVSDVVRRTVARCGMPHGCPVNDTISVAASGRRLLGTADPSGRPTIKRSAKTPYRDVKAHVARTNGAEKNWLHEELANMTAFAPGLGTGPLHALRKAHSERHATRQLQTADSPTRWSTTGTASDAVIIYIPEGQHYLLDQNADHRILVIEGSLAFADEADITLDAEIIIVNGGELKIGTADAPFTHAATITLHGSQASVNLPVFGAKVLGLTTGKILMYGTPKTSWLHLAATAAAGASTLSFSESPTGWQVGDEIIITSTSEENEFCSITREDNCQLEEATILSVVGTTVTLTAPLQYSHLGVTDNVGGRAVSVRAEVANLGRNVKIQGSQDDNEYFGGHTLLMQPTDGESAFNYVELFYMGQDASIGRYPLHFHGVSKTDPANTLGDVSGSTVLGTSIHHSFNRAINIHGAGGLLIQDCVAYKNFGHTFFIEDGSETHNTFRETVVVIQLTFTSIMYGRTMVFAIWKRIYLLKSNSLFRRFLKKCIASWPHCDGCTSSTWSKKHILVFKKQKWYNVVSILAKTSRSQLPETLFFMMFRFQKHANICNNICSNI